MDKFKPLYKTSILTNYPDCQTNNCVFKPSYTIRRSYIKWKKNMKIDTRNMITSEPTYDRKNSYFT